MAWTMAYDEDGGLWLGQWLLMMVVAYGLDNGL
jgi:hypothetical protein